MRGNGNRNLKLLVCLPALLGVDSAVRAGVMAPDHAMNHAPLLAVSHERSPVTSAAIVFDVRAWALLHNFRPWHQALVRANRGQESPAVRLNQHRSQDNWLHNLLVSASLAGYRR